MEVMLAYLQLLTVILKREGSTVMFYCQPTYAITKESEGVFSKLFFSHDMRFFFVHVLVWFWQTIRTVLVNSGVLYMCVFCFSLKEKATRVLGIQFMRLSVYKENLQERKNWSAQQVEEDPYHPRRMRQTKVRISERS